MTRLVIQANISPFTGYGKSVINIATNLVRLGIDVVIRPTAVSELFGAKVPVEIKSRFVHRVQPDDFELVIHPCDLIPTPEKITGYLTMHESSRLKPRSLDILKASDLVIVPSHWNAATFSAQGVNTPIHVVPLGCDERFEPMTTGGKFVFSAAGRMAHGGTRKGIEAVVEAFQLVFDGVDDVRLNVKIFPDCKLPDTDDPRISVTRAYLSERAMRGLLADSHCFVSAARGEGFGLHQIEAMAIGRPVIAAIYGGLAEFMNKHNSYPVKFRHVPADGYYEGLGNLIELDEMALCDAMLSAYENRRECEEKGFRAHFDVRHLSWMNTAQELLKVLKESGAL